MCWKLSRIHGIVRKKSINALTGLQKERLFCVFPKFIALFHTRNKTRIFFKWISWKKAFLLFRHSDNSANIRLCKIKFSVFTLDTLTQ